MSDQKKCKHLMMSRAGMDVDQEKLTHVFTTEETSFFFLINLFIYLFLAALGLLLRAGFSLVAASGGCSLLRCAGFSLRWLLLL